MLRCACANSRYDVVLTDYRLQGWSGLETLSLVREQSLSTPVLIVTGTLGDEMAVECLKQGAADYVRKDHLDRLPNAVRDAMSRAAHTASAAELAPGLPSTIRIWNWFLKKFPIHFC